MTMCHPNTRHTVGLYRLALAAFHLTFFSSSDMALLPFTLGEFSDVMWWMYLAIPSSLFLNISHALLPLHSARLGMAGQIKKDGCLIMMSVNGRE